MQVAEEWLACFFYSWQKDRPALQSGLYSAALNDTHCEFGGLGETQRVELTSESIVCSVDAHIPLMPGPKGRKICDSPMSPMSPFSPKTLPGNSPVGSRQFAGSDSGRSSTVGQPARMPSVPPEECASCFRRGPLMTTNCSAFAVPAQCMGHAVVQAPTHRHSAPYGQQSFGQASNAPSSMWHQSLGPMTLQSGPALVPGRPKVSMKTASGSNTPQMAAAQGMGGACIGSMSSGFPQPPPWGAVMVQDQAQWMRASFGSSNGSSRHNFPTL